MVSRTARSVTHFARSSPAPPTASPARAWWVPSPGLLVGAVSPARLATRPAPERGATSRPARAERQRSDAPPGAQAEGLALTGNRPVLGSRRAWRGRQRPAEAATAGQPARE